MKLLGRTRASSSTPQPEAATRATALQSVLAEHGVDGTVEHYARGPAVTRYGVQVGAGVKPERIAALTKTIAMRAGVAHEQVEVVPSVAGRPGVVGVILPNARRDLVTLDEVLGSAAMAASTDPLLVALGRLIDGGTAAADLARLPHLLIGGATGGGKSSVLNTILCSLITRATPDEVGLLLIDPKRVELAAYADVPHLTTPVAKGVDAAIDVLSGAERALDARNLDMEAVGAKNLAGYNAKRPACERQKRLVVVIDELADLMAADADEVERIVVRIAQLGRAAGIHLVLATQRPETKVVTGQIKANMPGRIALATASGDDSMTILGNHGAKRLLGNGDALFVAPGEPTALRVQTAFVSEKRIAEIVAAAIAEYGARS